MQIIIIGCGIVGATIAYELSLVPGLEIAVLDRQPPAQAATGAALGVLMGIISQKKEKSRAWRLRQASMARYATLIPELEAQLGDAIPGNRCGILKLCYADEDLGKWDALIATRLRQGLRLERLSPEETRDRYPQLNCNSILGAIYSPDDFQIDPVALTQALVKAAQARGVAFHFDVSVTGVETATDDSSPEQKRCLHLYSQGDSSVIPQPDWVIVAAGLGSTPLTAALSQPISIQPVLGQALHLKLDSPEILDRSQEAGKPNPPAPFPAREGGERIFRPSPFRGGVKELQNRLPQPVVTANDIHIVPLNDRECWVGATVEMPDDLGDVVADPGLLDEVLQGAIGFCPMLVNSTIVRQWQGLRPRPQGRSAPIIDRLPGYSNVLLAAGHYRNGVLLAPATALEVRSAIEYHNNRKSRELVQ
jgi:glycine oxidase